MNFFLPGRIPALGLLLALLAAAMAGCAPLRDFFTPAPGVPQEWAALLTELRAFERRIGFQATDNFLDLSAESRGYPFCGYAPRLVLPYSYEDPAIRWSGVETEQECRKLGAGADIYFGSSEAQGEIGAQVTLPMIESRLDRFQYLVIHEDCHDQFDLPYGIEEALCNVLAYNAMAAFTRLKFGSHAREDRAIRRYAALESRRTRETKEFYEQLEALYVRHERREVSEEALLKERALIFARAQWALAMKWGSLNNVVLATHMTYSRHYPFPESVFDAHGRDLARTVAFFRHVDRIKPAPEAIAEQRGTSPGKGVEFIRAYEAAVVDTIGKALADAQRR